MYRRDFRHAASGRLVLAPRGNLGQTKTKVFVRQSTETTCARQACRAECGGKTNKGARGDDPARAELSNVIEIKNLKTEFYTSSGVVQAVNGISYDVAAGETVAIVGESGCGKSVGAMSILRLIPDPPGKIVSGSIVMGDRDLLKLPMDKMRQVRGRDIGMIFQEPMTSLNPVLTIERQLTETLEEHLGTSEKENHARAVELLGLVGISEPERRLKQYPHQFSGGMRQRVMIAMALACNPKLIIADEPTTALDVTIQAQILELMKNLTRELGVAMIIITHNLGVVARYADRVNVMYAGYIVESGTAREIYHNPRHPYTLALLQSVPRMDQKRGAKLRPVDGQPPDLTKAGRGLPVPPALPLRRRAMRRAKCRR